MAKKTKKPKWTRAEKRKSAFWWVSLADDGCRPDCTASHGYGIVTLQIKRERPCGCVAQPLPDASGSITMSLLECHDRFSGVPELVPGGPPVRVRLRMEKA